MSIDNYNFLKFRRNILKKVTIYTDGACSCNPGPGGYCAILEYMGIEKICSGGESLTTNNIMELTAVVKGLKALKEHCVVDLFSDSAYVVNAINEKWVENWKNKGWKTADNKPVKNVELWQELYELLSYHSVTFHKVKGHSDNEKNNRCDEIARSEILKFTVKKDLSEI